MSLKGQFCGKAAASHIDSKNYWSRVYRMGKAETRNEVLIFKARKEMKEIDKFFAELEKDKTLPTFVDFFFTCLVLDTAEKVNLKSMYPKIYRRFSRKLKTMLQKCN